MAEQFQKTLSSSQSQLRLRKIKLQSGRTILRQVGTSQSVDVTPGRIFNQGKTINADPITKAQNFRPDLLQDPSGNRLGRTKRVTPKQINTKGVSHNRIKSANPSPSQISQFRNYLNQSFAKSGGTQTLQQRAKSSLRSLPKVNLKRIPKATIGRTFSKGLGVLGGLSLLPDLYKGVSEIGDDLLRIGISGAGYIPGVSNNPYWQELANASINSYRERFGLPPLYPSSPISFANNFGSASQLQLRTTFEGGQISIDNFPLEVIPPVSGSYEQLDIIWVYNYTDVRGTSGQLQIANLSGTGIINALTYQNAAVLSESLSKIQLTGINREEGYITYDLFFYESSILDREFRDVNGDRSNIPSIWQPVISASVSYVVTGTAFNLFLTPNREYKRINFFRNIINVPLNNPSGKILSSGEPLEITTEGGTEFNNSAFNTPLRFLAAIETETGTQEDKENYFPGIYLPKPIPDEEKEEKRKEKEIPFDPIPDNFIPLLFQPSRNNKTGTGTYTFDPTDKQRRTATTGFPDTTSGTQTDRQVSRLPTERRVPLFRRKFPEQRIPNYGEKINKAPIPTTEDPRTGTNTPKDPFSTSRDPQKEPEKINQTATNPCRDKCSAGLASKSDADNINQNIANNQNAINNLGQAIDLSLLTTINDKLGAKVPGGLSGFLTTAWKTTRADKALNAIGTLFTIHNAAMLSRSLGQSFGDLASQTLSVFNIKNENDEAIDVNDAIGNTIEGLLTSILGAEIYNGLKDSFNKANRIIGTASAAINAVRSIGDSVSALAELGAERTGKIGNALKKAGIVEDRAYEWMSENVNSSNAVKRRFEKITEGIESADSTLSSFSSAISEVKSIQDELNTFSEQKEEFQKEIKQATPKQREDNEPVKTAVIESQQASESSEIKNSDFFNVLE